MSSAATSVKLSPAIKALIAAPHALGNALPAPSNIHSVFSRLRSRGVQQGGIGSDSWLTLATAALVTINSPASLCELMKHESKEQSGGVEERVKAAAIIRETGLKCIGFSGIPRTINALGAFRSSLDPDVISGLSTSSQRRPTPEDLPATLKRGKALWDAIYEPHSAKLLAKLAESHPDLPVHILTSHYGPLFSDPASWGVDGSAIPRGHTKIGRVLTSIVAIACLRAQRGVGPQLTSHVFGLKKAALEGGGAEGEAKVRGQEWLTSDDGVRWVIESVDELAQEVAAGKTTFAGEPGGSAVRAKL